jgi:aminotransferase in exopolysaccharide biosynthesis
MILDNQNVIDFIRAQFQTEGFIPLHAPVFKGKEKEYLLDTIDSTFVSSVGAYVDTFEAQMQQLTQTAKAVAVVNGTAALQVALRLAGVKPGEEVLTQALTFVATANAIAYNQAHPVFLDVDRDTMGLSPTALTHFLEEYAEKREDGTYNKHTQRRIAACLPMHTFGLMCRIEEIVSICTEWNIPLIEDAAEALGSSANGKAAGSFGLLGTFSFNGNKIVTCGGGGAIVSNDTELGKKGKYLTTTAKVPHAWEYVHDELGYNFRMPNLNAALACAQLEQLGGFITQKRELFERYLDYFSNSDIQVKQPLANTESNHWLIALELPNREERDAFLRETNAAGVMTRPIWQLMYKLPMYQDCQRDNQENAEYLEDRIVNIPSSVVSA